MSGDRYHILDQNAIYFTTFTVMDWLDVFTRKEPHSWRVHPRSCLSIALDDPCAGSRGGDLREMNMLRTTITAIRSESSRLGVSSFPAGIYIATIRVEGGSPMSQCFVVNR